MQVILLKVVALLEDFRTVGNICSGLQPRSEV